MLGDMQVDESRGDDGEEQSARNAGDDNSHLLLFPH
jgi:hypothetical protein